MKKLFILLIYTFSSLSIHAQYIGLNTILPQHDLHLNGTMQITKDFKVGGSDIVIGNPGKEGQVLISKGKNNAPEWTSLSIPIVPPGSYSLVQSSVVLDTEGAILTSGIDRRKYVINEPIDTLPPGNNVKWKALKQLKTPITITKNKNRTNLMLQTIGHLSNNDSNGTNSGKHQKFTFAIGFFIDGKLKAVKPFGVYGNSMSFSIVTLIATLEDLPIGTHSLEVAVIPRLKEHYDSNNFISIGTPNSKSNNLSPFMTHTTLQIDVLEVLN